MLQALKIIQNTARFHKTNHHKKVSVVSEQNLHEHKLLSGTPCTDNENYQHHQLMRIPFSLSSPDTAAEN